LGHLHKPQQASQKYSLNQKDTLLVVMSAVDWWKSLQTETLLGSFASGVRWNILRLVGKLRAMLVSSLAIEILQQSIRTIPTRSSHFVHTQFERLFLR
jgi:hypothetical protein